MQYLNHFLIIISGFLIVTACSSEENKRSQNANNAIPDSSDKTAAISSQQLLNASLEGNYKMVQKAVKQEIHIDEKDQSGRTPLMLASYNGHTEIVRYLLSNGADPQAADKLGRTALAFAASGSFTETVKVLLQNGSDPNRSDTKEEWTPLMWAAAEGNEKVIRVLLNHGADPTLKDKDNETARDFAENNGHDKIATMLEEAENSR